MEAVSAVACGKAPVAGRLPGSEAVGPGVGVGGGGAGGGGSGCKFSQYVRGFHT